MTTPVLPLRTQLAFSAQAFFDAAMDLVVLVFLGKFYVDVALLPAGLLALAIAGARAFDAVIDPVMGYVTDHTRSRFGRRKPWICAGMLGSAVVFYLLLSPPTGLAQGPLVSWFLACFAGHFFCTTLVRVPKGALAAELSFDPQERVRFFGLIAVLTALGLLAGTLGPTLLQRGVGIADPREQMSVLAALCSLGSVLSHLWLLWAVRERRDFQERGRTPLVPAVRHVLRNRPFMVMLLSTVVTVALVPAAFNLLGLWIMRRYPLSEASHAAIRAAAAQHARGQAALDPITGQHLPPPNQRALDEETGFLLDHFSLRELRAYARGKGPLQSVLVSVTGSAVLTLVAMLLAVRSVTGLDTDPGPVPSLAIVTAGAGFTALLFHALRVRSALALRARPVAAAAVAQHLDTA